MTIKMKVIYTIVDSTKKEGYYDIVSSNGEHMATFEKYHDALDYASGYLEHKDIIDGDIDLDKYKVN